MLLSEKECEERAFLILYFGIGIIDVVAEYFEETTIIYILKPLLIPILALMYWRFSNVKNNFFLVALFFVFVANVLFISKNFNTLLLASIFFFVYRALVIYLVIKNSPIINMFPIILGSLPFVFAFIYIIFLTQEVLGKGIQIYLAQVIFLSFFGGLTLSNYMLNENKSNFWILLNAVFFAIIQFILVLRVYYVSTILFQPISMLLYLVAQFALYKYMLEIEKK